ncbi:MAG: cytochrome P450, partial [Halobacteria archaeon]|nr:cytochrome P450 [Halobacteria archaeon]
LAQYLTHRDAELWDSPWEFRPERFAPERNENRPSYAYYPFGGGARMCIGREFALAEAPLILATAVNNFKLELECPDVEPRDIGVDSAITMIPDSQ